MELSSHPNSSYSICGWEGPVSCKHVQGKCSYSTVHIPVIQQMRVKYFLSLLFLVSTFLVVVLVAQLCLTLRNPMDCRLLCLGNSPGKNIGVGWHFLFQGIVLAQESSPVPPALAGRFYTIAPPRKPNYYLAYPYYKKGSRTPWGSFGGLEAAYSITRNGGHEQLCSCFICFRLKSMLYFIRIENSVRINGKSKLSWMAGLRNCPYSLATEWLQKAVPFSRSHALKADSLPCEPPGKPHFLSKHFLFCSLCKQHMFIKFCKTLHGC